MSARDLEDFIKVIETAETLSKRPESSIWSYPTDIFSGSTHRRWAPTPLSNAPHVPKLWEAKSSSEFLGSSWASSSSTNHKDPGTPFKQPPASSSSRSSNVTTVRSATTNGFSTKSSVNVTPKENGGLKNMNVLMAMQKPNPYARVAAKELMSSMSPSNSPRPPRKANKSPGVPRKGGTSKSPTATPAPASGRPRRTSKSPTTATTSTPDKSSTKSSVESKKSSTSSSVDSIKRAPLKSPSKTSSSIEPKEDAVAVMKSAKKTLSRSKTVKNDATTEDFTSVDDEQEPRPVPKPRPKVTIRQNKVEEPDESQTTAKTQQPVKKPPAKRPKSAPAVKKPEPKVDLRSYSKSLKLLGLDIPSNRTEATKVETHTVEIKTNTPTLRTRLKERTQSVSDLKEVVDSKHYLPKDEYNKIKSKLTNAVFEEWYFNKMKAAEESKRKELEKKEEELIESETKKVELKAKAAEDFQNWLKGKQEQRKKEQSKKDKELKKKKTSKLDDIPPDEKEAKVKAAEDEWKAAKKLEFQKHQRLKRRLLKKQEEELKQQKQKREEAEVHFIKWKDSWSQKEKTKIANVKKKKLEELEAKKLEAKEKKESADAAFKAWLAKKADEHKQKKSGKKDLNGNHEKEKRLEAAKEAYESWLDYVEQREEEQKFVLEETVLRDLWRPPWYPAGIADY